MEGVPRSQRSDEEMVGDGPLYTIELEFDLAEGTTKEQVLSLVNAIHQATIEHETHGHAYPTLITYVKREGRAYAKRSGMIVLGG